MAKLGELLAIRGEYGQAITAYGAATAATSTGRDSLVTHAFLRVLEEAERTVPAAITPDEHMSELEKLAECEPDDPYIPIAMARMDVKLDPQNPSFAVARAYARLERFRLRHKSQSLESLAPGSTEEWVDFHLALDPDRTEALLQSELELEPGALAPWLLLGRLYITEGKTHEAIDQFALAFGLAPGKSVVREYTRARVWAELSVDAVSSTMRQVMEAEGQTTPDEELLGLAARALYNMGPSGIGRALALLEPTNAPRDNSPSSIERMGWIRALAWSARGEPDDLLQARRALREILPLVVDPYRKTMVLALAGMTGVPTPVNRP
jgi:tetratricopeptide (TPR) repeat protein